MAFLETYGKSQPDRDYGCPKYVADASGKRCRHYLKGGACALADEFMCVEWLKANGHAMPEDHPSLVPPQTELFGSPVTTAKPSAQKAKRANSSPPTPSPAVAPASANMSEEVPVLAPIPKGDIDSFKALGVEVCLNSEDLGEVWLVPAYRDSSRKEISIEHAATLCLVVGAFPGSTVTAFEKHQSNATEESST